MKLVESNQVELKEIINPDFKKEIVTFANTDGGDIYIKVSVSRGEKRPYHLSDKGLKPSGVYIRHGVTSAPASEEDIRQMIKENNGTTFDKARSLNQDLTFEYASRYFYKREVKFAESNKRSLGLISSEGYYTNTALLLSDQCEHSIKCGVYEGTGKTKFKARKEFSGSILKQLEDAYEYINLNNNVESDFEGLLIIDKYDYPKYALREALLNSIVHRDYDYSGSSLVNIFSDRMEFVSIGVLVKGITFDDVKNGVSQSRNTVIANVFYRLKLIESYGTGIQRILESYENSNIKPKFSIAPTSFVVIIPNINFKASL